MEKSSISSGFDKLVESGMVQYDNNQEIITHAEGGLKVRTARNFGQYTPRKSYADHAQFQFVLTSALTRKPTIQLQRPDALQVEDAEKFLDGSDIGTAGFELGSIGSTHFVVANRFSYAKPHLMLLTSDGHKRQYDPLNESDLGAAWTLLDAIDGDATVFFNCGRDGGCSRLHKHMQLIPTPAHTFASFLDSEGGEEPSVPFRWFYRRLEPQHVTPADLGRVYNDLLAQATSVAEGLAEHADSAPPGAACPHNMVLTKRWMVVIPRRRAAVNKQAGANSMGMLGYIAIATRDEIDGWVRRGLVESLKVLGVPKEE